VHFDFTLKLKSSPGEELQGRQYDDPESPRPSARRGCRLHRVRQADAVHGQVSKNCKRRLRDSWSILSFSFFKRKSGRLEEEEAKVNKLLYRAKTFD